MTVSDSKTEEIVSHLQSLKASVEALHPIPENALTYSELKMQLMVNYVANLCYFISLKKSGESVANHPVFKHLAYLRTFMERLVPVDAALKYQTDKLLLENTNEDDEQALNPNEDTSAAPNLVAFMPSMSSAVKRITADQVKKSLPFSLPADMEGSLEIDPALIAAQIQKVQEQANKAKSKRKVKTYVEEDSEDDRIDDENDDFFEEEVPKKKASKKSKKATKKENAKAKKKGDEDDEEIESDFEL